MAAGPGAQADPRPRLQAGSSADFPAQGCPTPLCTPVQVHPLKAASAQAEVCPQQVTDRASGQTDWNHVWGTFTNHWPCLAGPLFHRGGWKYSMWCRRQADTAWAPPGARGPTPHCLPGSLGLHSVLSPPQPLNLVYIPVKVQEGTRHTAEWAITVRILVLGLCNVTQDGLHLGAEDAKSQR